MEELEEKGETLFERGEKTTGKEQKKEKRK